MKNKILNNIGLKISAIIFAILLWGGVMQFADPVTTKAVAGVPVELLNVSTVTDTGKVYQFVNGEPTVVVMIEGKTSVLREITSDQIYATADFKNIELGSLLPVQVSLNSNESTNVTLSAMPINLEVRIEDSEKKNFPITPVAVGEVATEKVLGTMKTYPETISVSGPESIINIIDRVVAQVNVAGVDTSSRMAGELIMYDKNGAIIDQTTLSISNREINVDVGVQNTKSVSLKFNVSGTPAEGFRVVDIDAEPGTVLVTGTDSILEQTATLEIPGGAINVEGMSGIKETSVDITEYLPEGIALVDPNANNVAVTIQMDEFGTKSFEIPIGSLEVANNPDKLNLEYLQESVLVTFTGPDDVVEQLSEDEVRLSIDLKDIKEEGKYTIPIIVSPIDECELVEEVTVEIEMIET